MDPKCALLKLLAQSYDKKSTLLLFYSDEHPTVRGTGANTKEKRPVPGHLLQARPKDATLKGEQWGLTFLFRQFCRAPRSPASAGKGHVALAAEVPQLQAVQSPTCSFVSHAAVAVCVSAHHGVTIFILTNINPERKLKADQSTDMPDSHLHSFASLFWIPKSPRAFGALCRAPS